MRKPEKHLNYRKCQQHEFLKFLNAISGADGPRETESCDGNATISVNLADLPDVYDPRRDREFWICSEHFHEFVENLVLR